MSGPQIWLCLFTFRPIALNELNGLTTIDTLSWPKTSRVQSPALARVFMFEFLFCCCCAFTFFFVKNTLFVTKVCNSCYNVNLFSILNILQDLWPAIRIYRYRPSIFKILIIPFNKNDRQLCTWSIGWLKSPLKSVKPRPSPQSTRASCYFHQVCSILWFWLATHDLFQ